MDHRRVAEGVFDACQEVAGAATGVREVGVGEGEQHLTGDGVLGAQVVTVPVEDVAQAAVLLGHHGFRSTRDRLAETDLPHLVQGAVGEVEDAALLVEGDTARVGEHGPRGGETIAYRKEVAAAHQRVHPLRRRDGADPAVQAVDHVDRAVEPNR